MLTVISGINWGDEGKSKMVDLLSSDYDVVVRFQGGNTAGHTVVNKKGKFVLNLLPSGILRDNVISVMGPGMVIDVKHLSEEIERISKSVKISPKNLKISDRAMICMPYEIQQDYYEYERLNGKNNVVRRGIGQVYADKYLKTGIKIGDLRNLDLIKKRLKEVLEYKNLLFINIYNREPVSLDEIMEYLKDYSKKVLPYVCDTGKFLEESDSRGKKILLETQLGALRDIDFGIYPYTASFNTVAEYAPIGAGIPYKKIELSIGIMKSYASCIGKGPFVSELFDKEAEILKNADEEKKSQLRRVGAFDVLASSYGIKIQGADYVALTKLDVLSDLDEIKVCVAYEKKGKKITEFPYPQDLEDCKPIFKTFKGWKSDISKCRSKTDLPKEAVEYIDFLQEKLNTKIKYVSVGAEREAYIELL